MFQFLLINTRRRKMYGAAIIAFMSFMLFAVPINDFRPRLSSKWLHNNSYFRLTAEESLGAVFTPNTGGVGRLQASSSAVPYLRKVIKDQTLDEYHRRAILQLALSGGEMEVDLLENYVASLNRKTLKNEESQVLHVIPYVLGHMAIREVRGADTLLRRMCNREYWIALEVSFNPEQVDESVFRSVQGCAIGRLPDTAQLAAKTLDMIDDHVRKERVKSYVSAAALSEYVLESELRVSVWVSRTQRDYYRQCFNGDLDHPGPSAWAMEKK